MSYSIVCNGLYLPLKQIRKGGKAWKKNPLWVAWTGGMMLSSRPTWNLKSLKYLSTCNSLNDTEVAGSWVKSVPLITCVDQSPKSSLLLPLHPTQQRPIRVPGFQRHGGSSRSHPICCMDFPWICPRLSNDFPMVFLWFSCFPMVFPSILGGYHPPGVPPESSSLRWTWLRPGKRASGSGAPVGRWLRWVQVDFLGKPWENHRKTIGKWWFMGIYRGFIRIWVVNDRKTIGTCWFFMGFHGGFNGNVTFSIFP